MVNSPYFVNCSECQVCRGGHCPYSARCVPGPSSFTNSGLPSLFHQVHVPSPPLLKTKLPLHRTSPVQGQIKQICGATLLAVLTIQSRPLCREPTFPCSVTGAARQRILRAMPVSPCPPRTIMQTRSVSPSQHRGLSVTALCALLSLHWFKAFIPHTGVFVNTQFQILFRFCCFRRRHVIFIQHKQFLHLFGHGGVGVLQQAILRQVGTVLAVQRQQHIFSAQGVAA